MRYSGCRSMLTATQPRHEENRTAGGAVVMGGGRGE